MLILHDVPNSIPADISPAEMQSIIAEYSGWAGRMAAAGRLKGGEKLTDDGGKHMRSEHGKVRVIDGPYAEVKEVVGGYFLIEADSYAHAVELNRDNPHLKYGAKIEIREVQPT
jgi:hypothetical protein